MIFFIFLLGLAFGSFANVLIDRLPKGEDVMFGRSKCDYCRKTLAWYELIPLISFLLQGGRCRKCRKRLNWQYPLVELATAAGFACIYAFAFTSAGVLVFQCLVFFALLVIFVTDGKYQIIPDSMVAAGLIGVLIILGIRPDRILTALVTTFFFYCLYLVTRGRGLGFGDVKFSFLLGYLAGYPKIIVALYLAFLTGAAGGVILILAGKRKLKSRIAFGPFLVIGLAVSLVWGDRLISWFLKFL